MDWKVDGVAPVSGFASPLNGDSSLRRDWPDCGSAACGGWLLGSCGSASCAYATYAAAQQETANASKCFIGRDLLQHIRLGISRILVEDNKAGTHLHLWAAERPRKPRQGAFERVPGDSIVRRLPFFNRSLKSND